VRPVQNSKVIDRDDKGEVFQAEETTEISKRPGIEGKKKPVAEEGGEG
jgi:hypothetical protein